ncbi:MULTISPECIES: hypothetical protein [unclassified Microcoleus]|uniref:hypothetical protein n=1 Tax=unclassified Microcoleus TaxID=2642155 RepID=UPI002FCEB478
MFAPTFKYICLLDRYLRSSGESLKFDRYSVSLSPGLGLSCDRQYSTSQLPAI